MGCAKADNKSEESDKTAPAVLNVEVFKSFDEVMPLQKEWDEFIESIDGEIFLSYDWCRVWWKYYGAGRDLRIIVVRCDGAIVAILPVFLERLGFTPVSLRVVRFVGTDHMPVTIMLPIDPRHLDQVVLLFIEELNRQYRWDLLYIGALCGRFAAMDEFVAAFNSRLAKDYRLDVKTADVQTYFHLSDSWEKQLAGLKKKQRKNINRAYKILNGNSVAIKACYTGADTVEHDFQGFYEMHQRQWQADGAAGHFGDWPHSHKFHKEVAACQQENGRLRLMKIDAGDVCLGYKYGYRMGKTYYQYLSARNTSSDTSDSGFNQVSFGEQVKKAIEEKVTCLDSMRGLYPHKVHLGGILYPIRHAYIYPSDGITVARVAAFRNIAGLFDILYNKIWRRRLVPRMGLKLQPFIPFWIKTHPLSPNKKA